MDNIAEKVLDDCVFSHASAHARTLELREQKKLEEERKKRQAVKDTEIRKKNRRLARAKAEKDAKVAALKAEIRKVFFERAEVIHPATTMSLLISMEIISRKLRILLGTPSLELLEVIFNNSTTLFQQSWRCLTLILLTSTTELVLILLTLL
jgi:hypothetical protein